MKRIFRIIASVLALSLMFVFLGCNVLAASLNLNGAWSGSKTSNLTSEFAALDGRTISVSSNLTVTLDPNTEARTVSAYVFLQRKALIGYENVMTQVLQNGVTMSNPRTTAYPYYCSYYSSTAATGDGRYRVRGQITGATQAFLSQFTGQVTYAT